ncbi:MAG: pyrroline-5-carboxylate reductase [Cryobacterium sp.]|nr:pyrroline-5-carboxylate reductase [Cryobacterium sp.]
MSASPLTLPAIAILGAGAMGGAIAQGLLAPSVTVTGGIRVTNRSREKAEALAGAGLVSLALADDPHANLKAVAGAHIVIVAVKPAMIVDLLTEIGGALEHDAIVVSVAAGVTTATMEAALPASIAVLRAMPNTPAHVGLGVTGIAAGSRATDADLALAEQLFGTVGETITLAEGRIDALSAVSGSGPAYVYLFMEKFTEAALALGFSETEARTMVESTFRGASELLVASGSSPAELRRQVTSPKGTTEQAIAVFEAAGLTGVFERATAAAIARARELAGD